MECHVSVENLTSVVVRIKRFSYNPVSTAFQAEKKVLVSFTCITLHWQRSQTLTIRGHLKQIEFRKY